MEGFLPRPEYPTQLPFVDPLTGLAEKFVLAGDPTTGTGWIDGIILPPGDRRLVMNTGPFEMSVGDTQDVVVGLIGGMGTDNLTSISVLKYNDGYAQWIYDLDFIIPERLPKPLIDRFAGDKYVMLDWANAFNMDTLETMNKTKGYGGAFEGYEIFQLPNITSSPEEGKLVAQYDISNGVVNITAPVMDPNLGFPVTKLLHKGTDQGIVRNLKITKDYLKAEAPLVNNKDYHYGIRAYSYSSNDYTLVSSSNGKLQTFTVTPRNGVSGLDYSSTLDTVSVVHQSGLSDGLVKVDIVNPQAVLGHEYIVYFEEDTVVGSATKGNILWNLKDLTTNSDVLKNQSQKLITDKDSLNVRSVHGIRVRAVGTPNAFKNFLVTAHGGGAQDPPLQGAQDFNGFPVTYTGRVNQSNGTGWFFHGGGASSGSYDAMISRIIRGSEWKYLIPYDFEYRFTYEDDNYAYLAYTSTSLIRVPMELWNITLGYRLPLWSYDYDGNEAWGLVPNDHPGSGGSNDPYTDWIYPRLPADTSPGEGGYQTWLAASIAAGGGAPDASGNYVDGGDYYSTDYGSELMGRNVWYAYNLDDVSDGTIDVDNPAKLLPEKGTVFKIMTNKINTPADTFYFKTVAPSSFTIVKGDVNADNAVDVSDVVTLVDHIIELTVITAHNKQYAADYNSDYAINIADGVGIINKILGISGKVNDGSKLYKSVIPEIELNPVIYELNDRYILKLKIIKGSTNGMEFEIKYPNGLNIDAESISLSNNQNNILKDYYSKDDGSTNFVLMKTDGSSFLSDDEIQLVFQHSDQSKENDNDIRFMITNVVLSSSDGQTQDFTLNNAEAFLKIIPDQFALHSIYPNPFNPIANIPYDVAKESFVSLIIYDLLGREVIRLVDKYQMPGKYHIRWNGKNSHYQAIPSGVYFIRFDAGDHSSVKKITLLK